MPSESPKALIRRYFETYSLHRPEEVMAFVHPDHVYHPPGGGEPMDRRGRQADEAPFFAAFTDIVSVVEDQIAEGDRVASRVTMHCTHAGSYGGIAATGRRIAIPFIDISRIRDGKIVEEWNEFDMRSILRQLGSER